MGFRLFLYLFILIIGGLIGYKDLIPKKVTRRISLIQTLCLLFLLFIMGIRIGLDDRVIQSFGKLGFQAIIISIFSVLFSVLLVKLVRGLVFSNSKKEGDISES